MHDNHLIVGIHVTDRVRNASEVQKIMTEYGCNIKTRVGLHHVDEKLCSPNGLILLEMFGDEALCMQMADRIAAVPGVDVQKMLFKHG